MTAPSAACKFVCSAIAETTIGALQDWAPAKAQRYFASDFDRHSDRLLDASGIEVIEVVMSRAPQRGTACVRPVQQ
jgi:hypothetical protein